MKRLAAQFWFWWVLFVGLMVSLVVWTPYMIALRLWPTAKTFWRSLRAWSRTIFGAIGFRVDAAHESEVEGPVVYVSIQHDCTNAPRTREIITPVGWPKALARLKSHLESGSPMPWPEGIAGQ